MSRDSGAGAYSQGIAWPSPRPQLGRTAVRAKDRGRGLRCHQGLRRRALSDQQAVHLGEVAGQRPVRRLVLPSAPVCRCVPVGRRACPGRGSSLPVTLPSVGCASPSSGNYVRAPVGPRSCSSLTFFAGMAQRSTMTASRLTARPAGAMATSRSVCRPAATDARRPIRPTRALPLASLNVPTRRPSMYATSDPAPFGPPRTPLRRAQGPPGERQGRRRAVGRRDMGAAADTRTRVRDAPAGAVLHRRRGVVDCRDARRRVSPSRTRCPVGRRSGRATRTRDPPRHGPMRRDARWSPKSDQSPSSWLTSMS